ncbi:MAG TPA: hypothetical protein VHL85_06070 [Burkholderiales bacterium]|jgi:hypothetical protein|nr:hypothetical protein [Burkholderiales bacterium]
MKRLAFAAVLLALFAMAAESAWAGGRGRGGSHGGHHFGGAPLLFYYPPPAPQSQDWFYCPSAGAYYPYVKQCAGGWQRVLPQPMQPSPVG